MRVVFLTHNYPRYAGDVAGGFLHPLAVALRSLDVDVTVVAPSDRGKGGDDELDGVPIRRVRYADAADETWAYTGTMASAARSPGGWRAFHRMVGALRKGALEVAAGEPAVVHAHWWLPAGMSAPPTLPLVITCHGTDVRLLERSFVARWLARRPLRRARVVTTVSSSLAETLRVRAGIVVPDDMIQPMPVAPIDRPLSLGGGGIVVIGRLSAQKRVKLAIDSYAKVRANGVAVPLTIVGDGVARGALEQHAEALGLSDTIRFVGAMSPAEVSTVLGTADLCLMTARREGFGLVAAEALMQGVPVVACTDGGGLLDVVPTNGAGRLALPNSDAIAAAVLEVLADSNSRQAAAAAGAVWQAKLSVDAVADKCIGWYQQALHG
jgi:glycosyltransferase involved in cell wall biosynthesis